MDGRLPGESGEVVAAQAYDPTLLTGSQGAMKHSVALRGGSQIKATMKNALTFPVDHISDYYFGIRIHIDGTFTEFFNGLGQIAWEAEKNRASQKTNLHSVSISPLGRSPGNVAVKIVVRVGML